MWLAMPVVVVLAIAAVLGPALADIAASFRLL
jgi:hypothetical protein